MASAREISDREALESGSIHLYMESIFRKACRHSAYLLARRAGRLKPSKKHIKTADCEVVPVGFPCSAPHKYFPEEEIERTARTGN